MNIKIKKQENNQNSNNKWGPETSAQCSVIFFFLWQRVIKLEAVICEKKHANDVFLLKRLVESLSGDKPNSNFSYVSPNQTVQILLKPEKLHDLKSFISPGWWQKQIGGRGGGMHTIFLDMPELGMKVRKGGGRQFTLMLVRWQQSFQSTTEKPP